MSDLFDSNGNVINHNSDNECRNPEDFQAPAGIKALASSLHPETSHESAAQVNTQSLMTAIWRAMYKYGEDGCISDELVDDLPDWTYQGITGRFTTMFRLGMIEYTGEKRRGHKCNRMQMVRRVLPEPHIPVDYKKKQSKSDELLGKIRVEVKTLRSVINRLTVAEDRVRMKYIVRRLEALIQ